MVYGSVLIMWQSTIVRDCFFIEWFHQLVYRVCIFGGSGGRSGAKSRTQVVVSDNIYFVLRYER